MQTQDYAALPDEALLGCWLKVGLDVPEALVQETLDRGSRMVPLLGPLIAEPTAWEDGDLCSGWASPHAVSLLTQIGGPGIIPYVAAFLRHGLGEDWMTEEGHMLAYAGGMEGLAPMAEVIGDPDADVHGRWAAIDGLCMLGLESDEARPKVSRVLRLLAQAYTEKPEALFTEDDAIVLTQLGQALAFLHDEPSREILGRAFAMGRWDGDLFPFRELSKDFEATFADSLQRLRRDPAKHFSKEELERLRGVESGHETPEEREMLAKIDRWERVEEVLDRGAGTASSPMRPGAPARTGRNDPCPCGSGRKFKKCCG